MRIQYEVRSKTVSRAGRSWARRSPPPAWGGIGWGGDERRAPSGAAFARRHPLALTCRHHGPHGLPRTRLEPGRPSARGAPLMQFHYIALEGAIGVGKTAVVERLAERLEANTVLEEWGQNPFLKAFYEGAAGSPFQAELFFLLSRHRQQQELTQRSLFTHFTISDYLFEKSKIFAYLNLEDSELLIYEKLYGLLAEGAPRPDLVVYLQAPTEVLMKRIRGRGRPEESRLSEEYLAEVNRAYNYYFFHYGQTPLLVVNTADVDLVKNDDDLEDLLRQIRGMGKGTQYYVPKGAK